MCCAGVDYHSTVAIIAPIDILPLVHLADRIPYRRIILVVAGIPALHLCASTLVVSEGRLATGEQERD